MEREDLDHAPLVGKFLTKGDCVRACAPFEHVGVGDRGVVAGPCSSLGLDSFRSRLGGFWHQGALQLHARAIGL